MSTSEPRLDIMQRIQQKRSQLEKFLTTAKPRKRRLVNTNIIAGSLAAALTAGPALGGQSLTAWLTGLMGLSSPSWRLLCAGACFSSVVATIATQVLKSNNIEEHVSRAQGCRAKLEVLEVGLSAGQLDPKQATSEYLKCVEEIAFLEGA
jgi:hypothetical protein